MLRNYLFMFQCYLPLHLHSATSTHGKDSKVRLHHLLGKFGVTDVSQWDPLIRVTHKDLISKKS